MNIIRKLYTYLHISLSGCFDSDYYLRTYSDVRETWMDPLLHYIRYGADEDRNPSEVFSTKEYREKYPEIGSQNPLLHCIQNNSGNLYVYPHSHCLLFDSRQYPKMDIIASEGDIEAAQWLQSVLRGLSFDSQIYHQIPHKYGRIPYFVFSNVRLKKYPRIFFAVNTTPSSAPSDTAADLMNAACGILAVSTRKKECIHDSVRALRAPVYHIPAGNRYRFSRFLFETGYISFECFCRGTADQTVLPSDRLCLMLQGEQEFNEDTVDAPYGMHMFHALRRRNGEILYALTYIYLFRQALAQGFGSLMICENDVPAGGQEALFDCIGDYLGGLQRWDVLSAHFRVGYKARALEHATRGNTEFIRVTAIDSLDMNIYSRSVFSLISKLYETDAKSFFYLMLNTLNTPGLNLWAVVPFIRRERVTIDDRGERKFRLLVREHKELLTTPLPVTKLAFFNDYNFGDLINICLFRDLFGLFAAEGTEKSADVIALGSILEWILTDKNCAADKSASSKPIHVWGTGIMFEQSISSVPTRPLILHAVRGRLTADIVSSITGNPPCTVLADPGLLASRLLTDIPEQIYDVGIVPHLYDMGSEIVQEMADTYPNVLVIDVRNDPIAVIRQIASCRCILSTSLHGLITADSFGIPNAWCIISDRIEGNNFKYKDYYSSFGLDVGPIDLRNRPFPKLEDVIRSYKVPHLTVLDKQEQLIESFPLDALRSPGKDKQYAETGTALRDIQTTDGSHAQKNEQEIGAAKNDAAYSDSAAMGAEGGVRHRRMSPGTIASRVIFSILPYGINIICKPSENRLRFLRPSVRWILYLLPGILGYSLGKADEQDKRVVKYLMPYGLMKRYLSRKYLISVKTGMHPLPMGAIRYLLPYGYVLWWDDANDHMQT